MFPLIIVEWSLIYLYIDGIYIDKFEVNEVDDCIDRIKGVESVDVCFLEEEDFYMNLILGRKLKSNSIGYQLISRKILEVYYLIYKEWSSNGIEIIDLGEKEIWGFLNLREDDLKISLFGIENHKNRMFVEFLSESVYVIYEKENTYFKYLEIRDRLKESYLQNLSSLYILNKIYLSGDLLLKDLFNEFDQKMTGIHISPKNNLDDQINIYYSYRKGLIKDPFIKKEIKYLGDSIDLNQYWDGKNLAKTIKVYNENDRLNSKVSIKVRPLHSADKILKYGLVYKGKEYYFNLDFPFIYYSSILDFEFLIYEHKLTLSVKLDELLIYSQVISLVEEEDHYVIEGR